MFVTVKQQVNNCLFVCTTITVVVKHHDHQIINTWSKKLKVLDDVGLDYKLQPTTEQIILWAERDMSGIKTTPSSNVYHPRYVLAAWSPAPRSAPTLSLLLQRPLIAPPNLAPLRSASQGHQKFREFTESFICRICVRNFREFLKFRREFRRIYRSIVSERELTFTFAVCCRPSVCLSDVCRLSVCKGGSRGGRGQCPPSCRSTSPFGLLLPLL